MQMNIAGCCIGSVVQTIMGEAIYYDIVIGTHETPDDSITCCPPGGVQHDVIHLEELADRLLQFERIACIAQECCGTCAVYTILVDRSLSGLFYLGMRCQTEIVLRCEINAAIAAPRVVLHRTIRRGCFVS